MPFDTLSIPALFLLGATSLTLVLAWDWRISLSVLGAQYLGVFFLVGISWPLEMAVIKLVTGWIAAAVLGMELVSGLGDQLSKKSTPLSSRLFSLFLATLVGFAIFSLAPQASQWMLQATHEQVLGGFLLIGMGVLHFGVSDHPYRVAIGILTSLSGFEVLYATVETSALVAGVLAVFSLGVALLGAYLMAAPTLEVED